MGQKSNAKGLFEAADSGDYKLALEAITNGEDVNATDRKRDGITPLMSAAHLGHDQVARVLIDNGADVDRQDAQGSTALLFAANYKNHAIMKLLLAAGAEVYTINEDK